MMVRRIRDRFLFGEKDESGTPMTHIGKLIMERLKKVDKGKIAMINVNTGFSLTYEQLLKQSIKLAIALRKFGIGKGDVVAIVSENVVNFWVPVLASFYVGATVNPLNPSYTEGELQRALDLSKPRLVFCSESAKETVLKLYHTLIYVEKVILFGEPSLFVDIKSSTQCFNGVDIDVDQFELADVDVDETAFILCSSGTTGFPKGVMLSHRAPRHYLVTMSDPNFGTLRSDNVILIVPPFYHLIGAMQQLTSVYCMGTSVIMTKFKPDFFLKSIQDYKVTNMLLVPTLMIFLSNCPLVDKYDLSSLREISWGGASMSKAVENAVKRRLNHTKVRQAYGATELGSVGTLQIDFNKSGTAGVLTHDYIAKVCNPDTDALLGPNEVGEVRFKAPHVMKGYVNDPAATAAAFDEDGFVKTGDAGYYDEDGDFYIVDRFKELIKYKAFQVPPAEIEAILLEHPAVKEAAVVPKPDDRAGELPLACVVKQDDKDVTAQELIDLVAANLSVQKRLYGGVLFLNELPKNKTGKILRRDLKQMVTTVNGM